MSNFDKVNSSQNFPELENGITKFWKEHKIFEKSVEQRDPKDRYVFYDGPPFITGTPHYGSLLPSIAKDVIPRYWTMNGKRVERIWGWDCHGLPIENKVENKLGLKNRRDIEKLGIQRFIDECYNYTKETSAEWESYIDRIGRWVDFKNSYKTMDQDYMESVIWVFKRLWDKGLVYEGVRVSLYCTRCGTPISNFEIAMDNSYEIMNDPAVTVKFKLKNEEETYLLAWTTTPWTLPSNKALVIDESASYVKVKRTLRKEKINGFKAFIKKGSKIGLVYSEKYKNYDLPGGRAEAGESIVQTIKREILEETGYKNIAVGNKVGVFDHQYIKNTSPNTLIDRTLNVYLVDLIDDQRQSPVLTESEKRLGITFKWIELDDVKNLNFGSRHYSDFLIKAGQNQVDILISAPKVMEKDQEQETLILAKAKLEEVFGDQEHEIVEEFKGKDLVGREYEPLFDYFEGSDKDFKVYAFEKMVSTEEGVGIVHSAPGFGEIDTKMGEHFGLSMTFAVNDEGKFIDKVEKWAGIYIKEADPYIIQDLELRGLLFKSDRVDHRYPYCYRCHTPLIQKAQNSWFLKVSELKDKMQESNKNINWVPNHLQNGRFKKGIEQAPDWCISRTRYWATPMPVWKCIDTGCDNLDIFGSREEIEKASGQEIIDLHRPKIDSITYKCKKCGKTMTRVKEVLDVWLDSASMPYAQIHYPFEHKEQFETNFPADFIVEYIAQTRAWFYVMHVISNAMFDKNSFKNVITTGVIFGTDGRKMSKSYGNYPDPKVILDKYGADPLRMYFMSSKIMLGEDINFNEEGLKDQLKSFLLPLWNSYSFFVSYANKHNWKPREPLIAGSGQVPVYSDNKLDQWIIAKLQKVIRNVRTAFEVYDIPAAAREYPTFLDDLSKWYIRRSRVRFNQGDVEALDTLYYVLVQITKLSAPLIPFMSEAIWQNIVKKFMPNQHGSVHLAEFPRTDMDFLEKNAELLLKMGAVREIVNLGQNLRVEAGIKVRQPLPEIEINFNLLAAQDRDLEEWMRSLIASELNVKLVQEDKNLTKVAPWIYKESEDGNIKISLNTELSEELKREGLFRELLRTIQSKRKKGKLNIDDRVELNLRTDDPEMLVMLDIYKEELIQGVNASTFNITKGKPNNAMGINGHLVEIDF